MIETPPSRRRLTRHHKVRRSADYLRCYRRGRRHHLSLATIHCHPNEEKRARLGITASRKVGKAVIRQRLKRRVREIFRTWGGRPELPPVDIVVHLKPAARRSDFKTLKDEMERVLTRLVKSRAVREGALENPPGKDLP